MMRKLLMDKYVQYDQADLFIGMRCKTCIYQRLNHSSAMARETGARDR